MAEEGKGLKDKTAYGDYLLKLVNLAFDPLDISTLKELHLNDEANLLGLTLLDSNVEVHRWALSIMREAAKKPLNKMADPTDESVRRWPLTKIYRVATMLARRSIKMRGLGMAVGLAGKQSLAEEEGEDEERGLDFRG